MHRSLFRAFLGISICVAVLSFGCDTLAAGSVYEPKPGSEERKAIMDAMREPISKHAGKRVTFTGTVQIVGDWATFSGDAAPSDGSKVEGDAAFDFELDLFVLLRKKADAWKVLYWGFAGDISALEEAREKFPDAPKALVPDLSKINE